MFQQLPVRRAGEHDWQPPGFLLARHLVRPDAVLVEEPPRLLLLLSLAIALGAEPE